MSTAEQKKVEITLVPLEQLHESPFNRRRTWGDLKELASSIAGVGILEPLLARPHPSKNHGALELVFGHRRLRAAKLAKTDTAPVIVRELTDEQAIEIQAVENLQRTDIHPLEEAEQYEQLQKIGRSANDIAAKVGKSPSYVHGRLKLLSLCEKVRKAFAEETITPAVALLIARIPSAEMQIEALEEVKADGDFRPAMSLTEAREWIEEQFMLRLDDSPFDRADATLVPKAGPCTTCPKRTGAQKELFADVKSGDLCLDTKCHEQKVVAHGKRRLAIAKESGQVVLEGKAGEKALNDARAWRGPTVDLGEVCNDDPKRRTYGALIKAAGADVKTKIALDRSTNVHELADRADVAKAVKKLVKVEKEHERHAGPSGGGSMAAQEKKWREAAEKKRVQTFAVMEAVVAAAEKKVEGQNFWPFLARLLLPAMMHDTAKWICKRRGIEIPKKQHGIDNPEGALKKALEAMDHVQAKGLAVELATAAVHTYSFSNYGEKTVAKELLDVAAFYKVDAKKLATAAVVERQQAKAAKKKAKRKGGRP